MSCSWQWLVSAGICILFLGINIGLSLHTILDYLGTKNKAE